MTAPGDPVVSIVIVAHSVRDELERCLDSIAAHAGVECEVVVVDNASTDGTREWLARVHPTAAVVPLAENRGVAAREDGLRDEHTVVMAGDDHGDARAHASTPRASRSRSSRRSARQRRRYFQRK